MFLSTHSILADPLWVRPEQLESDGNVHNCVDTDDVYSMIPYNPCRCINLSQHGFSPFPCGLFSRPLPLLFQYPSSHSLSFALPPVQQAQAVLFLRKVNGFVICSWQNDS